MQETYTDILIIGGGLAGLVSAIHLARQGRQVIIIEKHQYPRHKVCGEYVSNEVLPYLQWLGADPLSIGAKKINRFVLSTTQGKMAEATLPLGGFGVSRYRLDEFLLQHATQSGAQLVQDTVTLVDFQNDDFRVHTKAGKSFKARIVLGAFGKRSNMDMALNRAFIKKRSPFVAVKTHMQGEFPDDQVALHNFDGGYCGVSKVENGHLNVCYIASYKNFQRYKNIEAFNKEVLCKNPHLEQLLNNAVPVFEQPLSISQICFSDKTTVENHMLLCGDAAGMIHPLCGNGMAMAVHSAKIASELVSAYFSGWVPSRQQLEADYSRQWNKTFKSRITAGRVIQSFFGRTDLARAMMYGVTHIPGILPVIIRQTHGKVLTLPV